MVTLVRRRQALSRAALPGQPRTAQSVGALVVEVSRDNPG